MKHFCLLVALTLTLSACIVTADPAVPANNANSAVAQQARADAALQQAHQQEANAQAAAANETAQAQAAQRVRELNATATAQAVSVAYAQMSMTANAANLPSTETAILALQAAQALEAKATVDARAMLALQEQAQTTATSQAAAAQQTAQSIEAQATIDARAMLVAQQQTQATASAQALQRDNAAANQAAGTLQQQRELGAWLIPLLAVIAFGFVLVLGVKFVSGLIDRANEGRKLENERLARIAALMAAPTETIIFVGDPQTALGKLHLLNTPKNVDIDDTGNVWTSPASQVIDADEPPMVVILSNGEVVLPDSAEAREEAARCKLAMKLLRDAIDHEGAHSNRIPSAAQLGWPSGAWKIAVTILKPYGVEILHEQDRETYLVGQSASLQTLYIALGEKYLSCFPPSVENTIKGPIISARGLAANPSG
jgi:hypothetical protein